MLRKLFSRRRLSIPPKRKITAEDQSYIDEFTVTRWCKSVEKKMFNRIDSLKTKMHEAIQDKDWHKASECSGAIYEIEEILTEWENGRVRVRKEKPHLTNTHEE